MIRRYCDLLGFIVSLSIILMIVWGTPVSAQTVPDFDHSRFYRAKTEISEAILDTAGDMKSNPDKALFEIKLNTRLALIAQNYPIDHLVIVQKPDDPNLPEMLAVTLIGYEDEGGFIGWKFDTVFSEQMVFAFVIALQDRTIPEISWDEYYRYKVIKS